MEGGRILTCTRSLVVTSSPHLLYLAFDLLGEKNHQFTTIQSIGPAGLVIIT